MIRLKSVKTRLSISVSLLIILLICIVSYVTLSHFEASTKKLIEQQQFSTVLLLANEIDDKLTNALDQLVALSQKFPPEHIQNAIKANDFLDTHNENKTVFNNGIFLFNNSGIMIAETQKPARTGHDYSYREYLKSTLKLRKPYIGDPYFSTQQHKHPAVMLTVPIFSRNGQIVGILAGSIDLLSDNVLGRLINMKNGESGFFFLISKDRKIILHPDKKRILSKDIAEGANRSLDKAVKGFEGAEETITSTGIQALSAYKSLKSKDWLVGAIYPAKEAFAPIYKARTTLLLTLCIITLFVTAIIWSLMNILTKPFLNFTKHVESISTKTGDDRLISIESTDEIARLATAFNKMVTDLDRQQAELLSSKEHLSVTLRSIADGVIVTDINSNLILMNRVAETLTGWVQDEVLGSPLNSFFAIYDEKTRRPITHTVDQLLMNGNITTKPVYSILVSRDGIEYLTANSFAPIHNSSNVVIGAVLVFQDITEKRRLQNENIRSDKLESIGVLAGGIAHDFNNLLTSILGNISLAKMMVKSSPEKLQERLASAEFASLRARDLTKRLLTFSQGGAPIRKTICFSELLKSYTGLALSGSNAIFDLQIQDNLWPIDADFGQVGQVISNLLINADQSMPDGGKISIECCNFEISNETHLPLPPGKYLYLRVSDEGLGIHEEHINKIFEPYFTQKKNGRGLGLATVYSIIQNHNGHITVDSEIDVGTTFTLYLPASDNLLDIPSVDKTGTMHGKGNILIMDDEESVRQITGNMLSHVGFSVDFAKDGDETISMFNNALHNGRTYDLVIMDLTIPGGMGGKETITRLKEIYPKVRALVSSGYSSDPILSDYINYGFLGVILKPYKVEELCMAVIDTLKTKI